MHYYWQWLKLSYAIYLGDCCSLPISPHPSIVKKWRKYLANQINIKNNIPNRHWLSHNSYNCPNISNISLNSSTHPPILTPTPLSRPYTQLLKKSLIPILPFSQPPSPPSFHMFTKINVATLNVASLTIKAYHLLDIFNDLEIEVICLTETWFLYSDRAVIPQLTSDSLTFTGPTWHTQRRRHSYHIHI